MKIAVVLLFAVLFALSSCAGQTVSPTAPSDASAADETAGSESAAGTAETVRILPDTDLSGKTADYDLTAMDTQMAYVQLSNMMLSPEDYLGKTVKLTGTFAHAEENGKEFFVCYLLDATACCSQSLEFETDEAYDFPAGYPEKESDITVFGVFDTYEYNSFPMFRLLHAEVAYDA